MKDKIQSILNRSGAIKELSNCYLHPSIPEKKLRNAASSHDLNYDETIIFLYDSTFFGSASEGFLITEKGVSVVTNDSEPPQVLLWTEIDRVTFRYDKFYFFTDQGVDDYYSWERDEIASLVNSENKSCESLAKALSNIAVLFEDFEEIEFNAIVDLFDPETIEAFEEAADNYLEKYGEDGNYLLTIHVYKAINLLNRDNLTKAKDEINFCFHVMKAKSTEDYPGNALVYKLKGDLLLKEENDYEALTYYKIALDLCEDKENTAVINEGIEAANNSLRDRFLEKHYRDRKLILVDDTQADFSSKEFKVLLSSKLPDINFGMGHPVNKELYVGHPYNKQVYIPINSLEETLFMDKFQEFSYFLQSLGATRISIENKRGKESQELQEAKSDTIIDIDTAIAGSKTNNSVEVKNGGDLQSFKHTSRSQSFSPIRKPFLPNNLVWYHHETSWQRLYDQRINGNILNHTEIISTEQTQVITKNEKRSIEQSLKYYLAEANVTHATETDQMIKERETTEWTIQVEFAPIETLKGEIKSIENKNSPSLDTISYNNTLPSNERKYQTRVELLVEDEGQITEEDRRILDRVKVKLKISDEKARELEQQVLQSIQPSYSDNELSYIEEIKFCLEDDGLISDKERQILELEREELGISNERAIELEEEILQKLKLVEN